MFFRICCNSKSKMKSKWLEQDRLFLSLRVTVQGICTCDPFLGSKTASALWGQERGRDSDTGTKGKSECLLRKGPGCSTYFRP